MNYPEPGLYFIIVLSVVSDREGHFNIVFVPAEHSSIKYSTENTRENENKTENLDPISLDHLTNDQGAFTIGHKRCFYSHLFHEGQHLELWEGLDRWTCPSAQNGETCSSSSSCSSCLSFAPPEKQHTHTHTHT